MTVVRFPVEQTRLPGESRDAFTRRQAEEQWISAQMTAVVQRWDPPILEDLANGRESD